MSQTSRSLNLPNTPEPALQQFRDWKTNLRVVAANDSDKTAIPTAERIILCKNGLVDGSRFALNTIVLLADLTGATATIKLWIKEGSSYFLHTTTNITASGVITYTNLPPLHYIIEVTGLAGGGGALTLHGGGTY